MYKFIAEKTDGNETITNTRTFEATSYTSSRHASGKSGDVTINSAEGLHTPINVGEFRLAVRPSVRCCWHCCRINDVC
jgi:hypothetical protein